MEPSLVPLTGSEFEWNNCVVHESEDESNDKDHSVKPVEDSDAWLSPLTSNLEKIDLETEINESINEEGSHIANDSLDLPLMIDITSNGANVLRGKKNNVHKKTRSPRATSVCFLCINR